jgi:acyl-CoA hydrolase
MSKDEKACVGKRQRGVAEIIDQMMPVHANGNVIHGKMHVHGGEIMKIMDKAAAAAARSVCRHMVVTLTFPNVIFKAPVFVGDLVRCRATVVKRGRTSMNIVITVNALREDKIYEVTEGEATFVSVDQNLQPIPVLDWDFKPPRIPRQKKPSCSPVSNTGASPAPGKDAGTAGGEKK